VPNNCAAGFSRNPCLSSQPALGNFSPESALKEVCDALVAPIKPDAWPIKKIKNC